MSTELSQKVVLNPSNRVEINRQETLPQANPPPQPLQVWSSVSRLFSFQTMQDVCLTIGKLPKNLFSLADRVFHASSKEKTNTPLPTDTVALPAAQQSQPDEQLPEIQAEKMSDDACLVSFFREADCFANASPAKIRSFLTSRNVVCAEMTRMTVTEKNLSSLPPEISYLSLEELDISRNAFRCFPSEIFTLSSTLKALDITDNFIEQIPTEISSLVNLEDLLLVNNKIKTLPPQIGALHKLETLNLALNKLESLPDIFNTMDALKELYLERNRLSALPESLCLSLSLKGLYCTGNQLTELPEMFGALRLLVMCNLSNNLLARLPDSIKNCISLRYLNLEDNRLSSLPSDLSRLTHLTSLSLSRNKFTSVPQSLLGLTKLTTLDLSGNPIPTFPEMLYKIPSLKKVCIDEQQFKAWRDAMSLYKKKNPTSSISFWRGGTNPTEYSYTS